MDEASRRRATAELAHEALIRSWSRLAAWVDADASFQRWLVTMEDRVAEDELLPEARIREAERWLAERPGDIPTKVQELIGRSQTALNKRIAELEEARNRAEEAAHQAQEAAHQAEDARRQAEDARHQVEEAARQRTRRQRQFIATLTVLLLVAVSGFVFAVFEQRAAVQQRDVAVSRQVAGQALDLRAVNPALAAQLALAAYRLDPIPEARGSLLSAFATPYATRLTGHTDAVSSVAFSPNGHTLATAGYDHSARLWDIRDPHHPSSLATLTGHTGDVFSVALSPDGNTLATGSADHTARLWDIRDPRHPTSLAILTGSTDYVNAVAFSTDEHTFATGSGDHTARLWDIRDPRHPTSLAILTGHTNYVDAVAFSPDGRTLATVGGDNTARLWDISDLRHPTPLATLTGHTNTVHSVAFSPNAASLRSGCVCQALVSGCR